MRRWLVGGWTCNAPAMTLMRHEIDLSSPPEAALAYACTATLWPKWHPSSLAVRAQAGPLPAGARFDEDIHAGGRPGHLTWEVVAYVPGRRWQAIAEGDRGLRLVLTYEVSPVEGGARFVRTLEYHLAGWILRLADRLVLRRRIERESAVSLRQLRDVVERAGRG